MQWLPKFEFSMSGMWNVGRVSSMTQGAYSSAFHYETEDAVLGYSGWNFFVDKVELGQIFW
jgi:hypothetical protein